MDWITANWPDILKAGEAVVAAIGAIVIAARLVVKLTPTQADDTWLAKLVGVLTHVGLHIDTPAIGGTSDEDAIGFKLPPKDGGALLLALILIPLMALAGCQAPSAVRAGEDLELMAVQGYAKNVEKIDDMLVAMVIADRNRRIDEASGRAMDLVAAELAAGRLTPAMLNSAWSHIRANEAKEHALIDTLASRLKDLRAANRTELGKALAIHTSVQQWLDAGLDESAIPGLTQDAVAIIQSIATGAAQTTGPPAAATAPAAP